MRRVSKIVVEMVNAWESRSGVALAVLAATAYSLTCLTYAWRFGEYSCKVFSFLWEENGYSEAFAGKVEWAMILLLCLAAFFIWIPKFRWVALVGAGVMLTEMLAETFMTSAKYPLLYWAEWALRYSSPLVAILLFKGLGRSRSWSERIMRVAIALAFAGHGLKALYAEPQFIDYILVACRRLGLDLSEEAAVGLLRVIGVVDLFLAAHLLILKPARNLKILLWIAAWGAITAFSRITYGGSGNWHEVLIRSTHFIIPVVLFISYRAMDKQVDPSKPIS